MSFYGCLVLVDNRCYVVYYFNVLNFLGSMLKNECPMA